MAVCGKHHTEAFVKSVPESFMAIPLFSFSWTTNEYDLCHFAFQEDQSFVKMSFALLGYVEAFLDLS